MVANEVLLAVLLRNTSDMLDIMKFCVSYLIVVIGRKIEPLDLFNSGLNSLVTKNKFHLSELCLKKITTGNITTVRGEQLKSKCT